MDGTVRTVKAFAKINLLLDILSRRDDGYHDLFMIMQSVDLSDEVTVRLAPGADISLTCDKADIPCDERNTAYKAARAFFDCAGTERGLVIEIKKRIPHAAGLAGGSADAAAVLTALRSMLRPSMSDRQLIDIAASVGADVPFCCLGGTMAAQGIGEILTYLPQLDIPHLVLVKPPVSVSTGQAYAAFDEAERVRHLDCHGMFSAVRDGDLEGAAKRVGNVFEQFIDVRDRVHIKAVMRAHGALAACMSGSGPSVFGVFPDGESAAACAKELEGTYKDTFLTRSVKSGTEIVTH